MLRLLGAHLELVDAPLLFGERGIHRALRLVAAAFGAALAPALSPDFSATLTAAFAASAATMPAAPAPLLLAFASTAFARRLRLLWLGLRLDLGGLLGRMRVLRCLLRALLGVRLTRLLRLALLLPALLMRLLLRPMLAVAAALL
jgi:hypothetical protein